MIKKVACTFFVYAVISIWSCYAGGNTPWDFFSVHAFDHLDNLDKQAEPAHLCGVSVLYASGVGVYGYMGIPPAEEWEKIKSEAKKYVQHAKSLGIPIVLGYLCSTSIVNLKEFDRNFPDELREQLSSAPADWLQQDVEGKSLPSWYGGIYQPACMNNPDWQKYQMFMVKTQLETGHDGIFFDNPTVHDKGCYCPYCMKKFSDYLRTKGIVTGDITLPTLREIAQEKETEFKQFRCTIARDFFTIIRDYAKSINPGALITANNSLNSPEVLFSQCHRYAYHIQEMSKNQDFVVIEDMGTAPRWVSNGKIYENAPTYALVNSIIFKKPLVAVTIADGDYHTPPNLTNLALFECFASNTNYMLWPTWEQSERDGMIQAIRPFVQWLNSYAEPIKKARPRMDVLLYLPFEQWIQRKDCKELTIARQLTKKNIQYGVASEQNFDECFKCASIVLSLSPDVIPPSQSLSLSELCKKEGKILIDASQDNYLEKVMEKIAFPSIKLDTPETVRGIVKDAENSVFILLYNLKVERVSSYKDKVYPVDKLTASVRIPFSSVSSVVYTIPEKKELITDVQITKAEGAEYYLIFSLSELNVAGIVEIKGRE